MNTAFFILAIMDFMAEIFHLTYQLGALTRRYGVPVLVGAYVLMDMAWESLTEMEMDIKFYEKPLALVRA